jgi:uncharacterized protein (TIGR03118 family)
MERNFMRHVQVLSSGRAVTQPNYCLSLVASLKLAIFGLIIAGQAWAQNAFVQHNLVSDIAGLAANTDTNLVNPWGIAFSGNSPFWISDNHAGVSTLYNGSGTPQSLIVTIPPPTGGTPPAAPTGVVFNGDTNAFIVASNAAARFIFATEDGTIVGWSSASGARVKSDSSGAGAVYKGLALGTSGGSNFIYATDFHDGKVAVFDANYNPATLAGSFVDTNIPPGFAPFNVANINGKLFVTYAKQDADKHDDVSGPGNGFINVFDTSGNLLTRFATNGALNSPWGMVMAPEGFGALGGTLLVGNFGDGKINIFDPGSGDWLGTVNDATGTNAFQVDGLWGLSFGNGGNGGDKTTLYFTAGIPGAGSVEDHGLFGSLSPLTPVVTVGANYVQHNLVSDIPGMADNTDTNLVNPWGIATSATSPFWISDNHSGLSTLYNSSGTPLSLVVTIPPPSGGTPPAAPTGIVFNGNTNAFFVAPNTAAHFIFATEDGTISGWASLSNAVLKADNSAGGTVYKGLALASSGGSPYLYASDFHHGKIDVFDTNFTAATLAGSFSDPGIPAGFAPFNVQEINGQLFVTYAKQDADAHDDVSGPGNGFVNVFDTSGNLVRRFASNGVLNSPWGLAWAPEGFGAFGSALLIGNFGDGRINAFDPASGTWLGRLEDAQGEPFSVTGLWALIFGNGASGGDPHTLYFTAGIPGSGAVEDHGLFGSLTPVNPVFTSTVDHGIAVQINWGGGLPPFLLQKKASLSDTNWINVLTTSNRSATVPKETADGFFRVQPQATNTVFAFTALLNGVSEVPPVPNTSGSATALLSLEGSNLTYQITFSDLSTPATVAHIHAPASPTNATAPLVPLTITSVTAGLMSGTVALTADQVADIVNGQAYVNIHTGLNPGGEIRGQIVPLHVPITLNGASEVPPVTTTATGTGTLTFIGSQMLYSISYSGLAGPGTVAHIHGPADTSTSTAPVIPLANPSGTSGKITGLVSIDPTNLTYVLAGLTYINIHSTTNTGGEIRGQIFPIQLGGTMNGASEVGPTTSTATASGTFSIVGATLNYNIKFANLSAPASAAHIHGPASPTQNATPIIPFTPPAATSGTISGTATLTPLEIFYLITGQTYANIHSATFPNGEIRGQVLP